MTSWQTKKLGELLTIRHGRNQHDVESVDGEYPILGTGGEIGRANKYLCNKPSVLIGRKGTIDKPRYMDTPFWTVDTLFYSDVHVENNAKFLYYVFETIDWRRYNEASGVPSLSASTISSIKINVPEKPEQERIVGVLEVWDEYIEKLEQKIALKEQLKKGLMQQLLTGRLRLPGYSADWRSVKLGDIAKMQSGGTPPSKNHNYYDGDVIWVSISDMTSSKKYISSSSKNLSQEGLANSAAKYYPAGTVLYAMYASIGECVIAEVPVTSSQAILGIQPSAVLDNEFLYYYLTDMKEKIKLLGQQGAQANLNAGIVKNFKLTLPGIKEQRSIALILSDVDDELTLLRQGKKHILKQKKYLLKNLITGAISTPENLKRIGVQ